MGDTITAWFTADKIGTIDSVTFADGTNDVFDRELTRVLMKLPQWNIDFERGVFRRIPGGVTIIFNEENRRKYKRE